MKYRCPKCGKEIEISEQELTTLKNHIVCPQCLSTLKIDGDYAYIPLDFDEATPPVNSTKPAEPEVTCPSCGKTLHGNPNFCPECGHNFRSTSAPEPASTQVTPTGEPRQSAATPPELPTQAQQRDEFYDDAVRYIGTCNAITTTMLQQYFNISYERAARLMQQLENNAIVGPAHHGRPRKILIQHNQSLPFFTKRSHKFDPVMMAMEDEQLKQTKGISDNRGCGCRSIVIGIILIYLLLILFALLT